MNIAAFDHVSIMAIEDKNNPALGRRETKTERVQVVLTPTVKERIKKLSSSGQSMNDTVSEVISKATRVPLLGDVPCGPFQTIPEEFVERYINVGEALNLKDGDFLLRARGDSMTGDGIYEGDFIQIRPQQTCDSGDIAVIMMDTPFGPQATLKRVEFSPNSSVVRLLPMSDKHEPIELDMKKEENKLTICGVKRGVIRMH